MAIPDPFTPDLQDRGHGGTGLRSRLGGPRVLLAGPDAISRAATETQLREDGFRVCAVADWAEVVPALEREPTDMLLLELPSGAQEALQLCRALRIDARFTLLPVIVIAALEDSHLACETMRTGADDFLTRPVDRRALGARLERAAAVKSLTDGLDNPEAVLFTLARMVEAKDASTGNHCDRLAHYCAVFGDWLGLEAEDVLALRRGGVLHDIGKLAIPDAILMKPGPLDGTEWEIMKMHPEMGAELIGPLMSMRRTLPVIRNHHERWDGSGYPDGLHGKDIPKLARIFQVTDVFDALSSRRSYKPSLPREAVVDQLRLESASGLLDPDVVEEFLGLLAAAPTKFLPAAAAPQSELGPRMFRLTYRPGE